MDFKLVWFILQVAGQPEIGTQSVNPGSKLPPPSPKQQKARYGGGWLLYPQYWDERQKQVDLLGSLASQPSLIGELQASETKQGG